MGKRKIKKNSSGLDNSLKDRSLGKSLKRKLSSAKLYVESTYNNTRGTLTDVNGNTLAWSSSGALGFKGAKKSTPYAGSKIGELLGEKATQAGVKEVSVIVKGVGSGRDSVIRSFSAFNIELMSIEDRTPVPHGGVKPPKPRRI